MCPQSPFGVLKNCGAQTNWASHIRFVADYSETQVFFAANRWLDDLKTRIRNAISAIPADMLHRTWQELEYSLDVLRATKGAHIEVYWGQ
jgi:phytoene/squalene synthetase